jgi:hypothetical protein
MNTNIYYGDDSTRDPTVVLINQTTTALEKLLHDYRTTYNNYILILENPPSDLPTVNNNKGNKEIQKAYKMFEVDTSESATDSSNNLLNAQSNYEVAISYGKSALADMFRQINNNSKNLTTLTNVVEPINDANRARVTADASNLLQQIQALQDSYSTLIETQSKNNPLQLEGNYEMTKLTVKSNFIKHMFYIVFAIIVVGCLCLLYFFPSTVYLDMFILTLAGIIIIYYAYDYFQNRNNPLNSRSK